MLRELTDLLAVVPPDARRDAYLAAVVEENALGKNTFATRQSSCQRLSELYGLSPGLPLFRVFRRLWDTGPNNRPLLAVLAALARDPLLRATAAPVLALRPEEPLSRANVAKAVRKEVGARMNKRVIDATVRRAASSWTQSGHLVGRSQKVRKRVTPGPAAVALALWLGEREGRAGLSLFGSCWAAVLDLNGIAGLSAGFEAGRTGLIRIRAIGNIIEVDTRKLDPFYRP